MGRSAIALEDSRAEWIWPWLDSVWQDAGYAMRSLRRQPGFVGVALLALGTAIGLNTSLFTVFAGMAFRPWAGMTDPSRVVIVSQRNSSGRGTRPTGLSVAEYRYLAEHSRSFDGLLIQRTMAVHLGTEGAGRSSDAVLVSANFFDVLGIRLERGRGFRPDDDRYESPRAVAVLGYAFWQTRYGGDPEIIGKGLAVNGMPFSIVGVASRDFVGPDGFGNLWLPLSSLQLLRPRDSFVAALFSLPGECCVNVAGRLATGVSRSQAIAELEVLDNQFRTSVREPAGQLIVTGTEFLARRQTGEWLSIFGLVGLALTLVLVIACANIGNLLLARATARSREIGVRLALGASRRRVIRQLLTEGFVLALAAGVIGAGFSYWLPPLVLRLFTGQARPVDVAPDMLVIGFAVLLATASCVLFALAPALHATRAGPAGVMKDDPDALSRRWPLRMLLLATQVAISVVLLVGAGLLGRGIVRARGLDLGFSYRDVEIATLELRPDTYDDARLQTLMTNVTVALAQPAIASFAFTASEPFGEGSSSTSVRLPAESQDRARRIGFLTVSPGYFDVLRIPVSTGRDFARSDLGRPVAVINESMARSYWPDQSALGQTFVAGGRDLLEVVGVAKDAQTDGFDGPEPRFYRPFGGAAEDGRTVVTPKLLFRATTPFASEVVAAIVTSQDNRLRVGIWPLAENIQRALTERMMGPTIAAVLGIFALGLTILGMFGTFAYVVRQRTREIGVRMALGARPSDVVWLVVAGHVRAIVGGLVVGAAGAVAASIVLSGFLYGLSPLDPPTYLGVAAILAVAGLLASYGPTRRATRIDPMTALRWE
jgi:predicted permease